MEAQDVKQLYNEFCNWSPEHAAMVVKYKAWGSHSLCLWLRNGQTYKAKRVSTGQFIMQYVSKDDINRKYSS